MISKVTLGFVEWIGDIRFPRFKDIDCLADAELYNYTLSQTRGDTDTCTYNGDTPAETGSRCGASMVVATNGETSLDGDFDFSQALEYSSNFADGMGKRAACVNKHSMYALGIQFEVNIPEDIRDKISGYSIVRVEREEKDKTVLGVGMGHWMRRYARRGNPSATYRVIFLRLWVVGITTIQTSKENKDIMKCQWTLLTF